MTIPPRVLLLTLLLAPSLGRAQVAAHLSAQAIPSLTSVDPVPGGGTQTEGRVEQPVLMLHASAFGGKLGFTGTLNLEGLTIKEGVLLPGGWGEGYNDRRHPHTYAHELLLSGNDLLGGFDGRGVVSVTVGKGFAPYGSDDPMSRPVFRYPVNHHLAQLLERAVAQVGVRQGPVALEAGLFNGDEPERPGQWPRISGRFGDSWSARVTVFPVRGVELSASRAKVHSPENRLGAGTDARKWHISGRFDRLLGPGRAYVLLEWARTDEVEGFLVFRSILGEGSYTMGGHQLYYRFERSDRPEDERTFNLYRSRRPHLENSILGTTRFTLHTVGLSEKFVALRGRFEVSPFVEGTVGRARNIDGGIFNPKVFYGKDALREISAGIRLMWQMHDHRMGRYGGLMESPPLHATMHHHEE